MCAGEQDAKRKRLLVNATSPSNHGSGAAGALPPSSRHGQLRPHQHTSSQHVILPERWGSWGRFGGHDPRALGRLQRDSAVN